MKKASTILLLLLFTNLISYSQSFYVEKTDVGYEQPILNKLIELKKEITTKQESSKFTIQCVISKKPAYGQPGIGYIIVLDSKSGTLITKSESAEGMINMFRGFKNPNWVIMEKVAKRHLEKILEQLKKYSSIDFSETQNIPQTKTTPNNKEEKLIELKNLYDKQLITKEEYEAEKKKILSD
jgi:hypothetical protein